MGPVQRIATGGDYRKKNTIGKKFFREPSVTRIILSLGANISGTRGPPLQTLRRTIGVDFPAAGIKVRAVSGLYETTPVGTEAAPSYLNTVVIATARYAPARLLAILKCMERRAGRRRRAPGAPRPLDIDLIDFGGRLVGWPPARRRSPLVLPHPEAHRRAFVLVPLIDVCPAWYHPGLGLPARRLLRRLPRRRGDVRRKLASGWVSCEEVEQGPVAG
jgi:2-amino-4-hydroxy-6-hydroxymethyldihydropteridine diphosphokinase